MVEKTDKARASVARRRHLVVQFVHPEDPSDEQAAVVRDLVKRFAKGARLVAELPGAMKIAVQHDREDLFRRAVDALPDWNVATESVAEMPGAPLPAHPDDDERS